jgi:uncharacterized membrane protein YphA (DoxX/SURF4 family)
VFRWQPLGCRKREFCLLPFFSTFPGGAPGLGLLMLRMVVGLSAIIHGLNSIGSAASIIGIAEMASGALLVIGLLTPVAGMVVAAGAAAVALADAGWTNVSLVVLAAAVVLLGPGAISVDSRLFGRKTIIIPRRR